MQLRTQTLIDVMLQKMLLRTQILTNVMLQRRPSRTQTRIRKNRPPERGRDQERVSGVGERYAGVLTRS